MREAGLGLRYRRSRRQGRGKPRDHRQAEPTGGPPVESRAESRATMCNTCGGPLLTMMEGVRDENEATRRHRSGTGDSGRRLSGGGRGSEGLRPGFASPRHDRGEPVRRPPRGAPGRQDRPGAGEGPDAGNPPSRRAGARGEPGAGPQAQGSGDRPARRPRRRRGNRRRRRPGLREQRIPLLRPSRGGRDDGDPHGPGRGSPRGPDRARREMAPGRSGRGVRPRRSVARRRVRRPVDGRICGDPGGARLRPAAARPPPGRSRPGAARSRRASRRSTARRTPCRSARGRRG